MRAMGDVSTPGIAATDPVAGRTATIPPTDTTASQQTSTWLPPLSPTEANAFALGMLETNGECELPCWWGIVPGSSRWEQTVPYIRTFASSTDGILNISRFPLENGLTEYLVELPDPEGQNTNGHLTAQFYVDVNGVIKIMGVPVRKAPAAPAKVI